MKSSFAAVIGGTAALIGAATLALAAPSSADGGLSLTTTTTTTTTTVAPCAPLDGVVSTTSTSTTLVPLNAACDATVTTTTLVAGTPEPTSTTTTTVAATQQTTTTTTTAPPAASSGGTGSQSGSAPTTLPAAPTDAVETHAVPAARPSAPTTILPSADVPAADASPVAPVAPSTPSSLATATAGFAPSSLSLDGAVLLGGFNASTDGQAPQVAVPPSSRSTDAVMRALASLNLSPEMRAHLFAPFPLAGVASYGDNGTSGTDMATAAGTPVVASTPGALTINGTTITLRAADGTTYTYGHVTQTPAVRTGSVVTEGTIIGHVADGASALRFEVRPGGGAAIDPVPMLDRWLAQALQTATAMTSHSVVGGTAAVRSNASSAAAALAGAARSLADPTHTPSSPIPAVVVIGTAALWILRRRRRAVAAVLGNYRDGGGRGAKRTFGRQ